MDFFILKGGIQVNKKWNVRMLAEGGVMIALAKLLSFIPIYQAPNGGSVTAGSMIPLLIFAIRWGIGPGIAVGATYGVVDFILKPYFYHPIQVLLDYPIGYGVLGLAGIVYLMKKDNKANEYVILSLGVILAIGARMFAHVLSGVVFFAEYAGDMNPWLYSIGYNATYLIPELIISLVILLLIWKPLKRTINN